MTPARDMTKPELRTTDLHLPVLLWERKPKGFDETGKGDDKTDPTHTTPTPSRHSMGAKPLNRASDGQSGDIRLS